MTCPSSMLQDAEEREQRGRGGEGREGAPVVIRGTEDVCWDDGGEVAVVFVSVASVHHIDHSLRISIAFIGSMRRTIVNLRQAQRKERWAWLRLDHRLVDGISGFVREDASRETRDELLNFEFTTALQDIVVDQHILTKEFNLRTERERQR
jgi:hypothetical protein